MRFLGSKYARNAFGAGAHSAPPDPLAGFKGPTSKGRGGEGREGVMGGKGEEREGKGGKGREEEGREGERGRFDPPLFFTLRRPCIQ